MALMRLVVAIGLSSLAVTFSGCTDAAKPTVEQSDTCLMIEGTNAIPAFVAYPQLRELHLRNVGLDRLYHLHFPATLQKLNLSANQMPIIPEDLIPSSVQQLWLADNLLTQLPQQISSLQQLSYLNVDRNALKALPDVSHLPLRFLRLNHNQLTTLPVLPETLERLYLANNKLTCFTTKPKALRQLTLADNPLQTIADNLGEGLEYLDLTRTSLTSLPKDLSSWQSLKVLILTGMPLSEAEKDRISTAFNPYHTTVIF